MNMNLNVRKFCKDCNHYRPAGSDSYGAHAHACKHPALRDPVSGEPGDPRELRRMPSGAFRCGELGAWWEPKQ